MRETLSLGCLVFWLGRISLTHDINGWWFGGWPKCDTNLIILHNITTCFMVFDDDDVQNASLLNLEPPSLNLPGIERHSSPFNYAFSYFKLFPSSFYLFPSCSWSESTTMTSGTTQADPLRELAHGESTPVILVLLSSSSWTLDSSIHYHWSMIT